MKSNTGARPLELEDGPRDEDEDEDADEDADAAIEMVASARSLRLARAKRAEVLRDVEAALGDVEGS